MVKRRTLLVGAALAPLVGLGRGVAAQAAAPLDASKLVYITPLKGNGEESQCKAEIWFAHVDGNVFVVTSSDAWRAKAVGRGLDRARMWVGEFGVWSDADGAFRNAPELMATAALETNGDTQERVLAAMGGKYGDEGWSRWGPRFEKGLADGSRVMIRYAIDA